MQLRIMQLVARAAGACNTSVMTASDAAMKKDIFMLHTFAACQTSPVAAQPCGLRV
jgi:hypothetical protein